MLRFAEYKRGSAFDVHYMAWDSFKAAILDPDSHSDEWSRLSQLDCIIGGVDYSIDIHHP